ncbi:MAG: T9SS type A sorting domain-containing protein, partial [candidate division KSB1 bacterium]|nr:T9SS type A sorting domain-containing protein [candidate division KSB1 bacterium]
ITQQYGTAGSAVSPDGSFRVNIPPGAVTANCSFDIFSVVGEEVSRHYPIPLGFQSVFHSDAMPQIYGLRLQNQLTQVVKTYAVSFQYPKVNSDSLPRIYAWDEAYRNWSHRPTRWDSTQRQLTATALASDRLFGLFHVADRTAPKLTVRIENQNFAAQDFVSSTPIISAVIEDESGIDMNTQPPQIFLDDQSVDQADLSCWLNAQSNKIVSLRYCPTLLPGDHAINIKVADIAGNWSEQTLSVTVSGAFGLQAIANHPNPFAGATIIAYTLTAEAQEVTLNIYTAAGRLIRRFEFANEVGYVEHEWDGCDEFGDEVANGVYYLKFSAKQGQQKIERVEKMAKLK